MKEGYEVSAGSYEVSAGSYEVYRGSYEVSGDLTPTWIRNAARGTPAQHPVGATRTRAGCRVTVPRICPLPHVPG